MSASDDQSEKECPLCMESFDLDDLNFYPCKCEYQICRFCWHRLRTDENGLCPACRQEYPEDPVNFKPLTSEEFQRIKNEKKQREQQKKQKISDSRKHLAKVRVLQKNLVFVIGLPPRYCEPDLLKRGEYFGKFGKVHKVVVNGNTNYAGPSGPSAGIFITYYRPEDALRAIQNVNSVQMDGRCIKASLGTTKYCSNFLRNQPCHKTDCMYLHDIGDEAASFTKEDMQQHKHTEYERRLHEQILPPNPSSRRVRDSSVQREIWPATPENENAAGQQQQAQQQQLQRSSDSIPITTTEASSNAASQQSQSSSKAVAQNTARTRQAGARNRNRQNRGAATSGGTQKQRGDSKLRASPPAASMSPDRNGRSLQSAMFTSSSSQGLAINNGNGGDSSTQSTSSSPSLFSSSLPNGDDAIPPVEIPQFCSTKALNGEATTRSELDNVDNDDERSTSKSPPSAISDDVEKDTKESDSNIHPPQRQPVCDDGFFNTTTAGDKSIGFVDEGGSKLSALFSKLLGDDSRSSTDMGKFFCENLESQHSGHSGREQLQQHKPTDSLDWQTALGLNKDAEHDDDLGFDPYMESSKALEEMVREEREMSKRQQLMHHQQQQHRQHHHQPADSALANGTTSSIPPWDMRNRYRSPPQHQQQQQPPQHLSRSGHIVRPSAAHWQHPSSTSPGMQNGQFGNRSPHAPFAPQSPPDGHLPAGRLEFVNSNFGPPPGFGDVPHKMNGVGGYPQGMHSFGQMRQQQQPQTKDALNLKDWQDGFRAILPNVNIKFAPNLSPAASHHASPSQGGPQHIDQPPYSAKSGWPPVGSGPGAAPRQTSENNAFMFNRPPPPFVTNCSYPPPGMRRSPTGDTTAPQSVVPPVRVNAPQQPPFPRTLSPFRQDFMNWPLDDLSPTSHPPPGFMAPPSQQNVA